MCAVFRLLLVIEISEKYTLRALSIINVGFVRSCHVQSSEFNSGFSTALYKTYSIIISVVVLAILGCVCVCGRDALDMLNPPRQKSFYDASQALFVTLAEIASSSPKRVRE